MVDNIQDKIENKIIDYIESGSGGRLIIIKPDKNQLGADLAVIKRGNYKKNAIYFQVNSFVGPIEGDKLIKDFYQEDLVVDDDLYLLFVYFDEVRQKIADYIWLIPSRYFRDAAYIVDSGKGEKLVRFEAPLNVDSSNEYSRFLVKIDEFGQLVFDAVGNGNKFEIKKSFSEAQVTNIDTLKQFISEARKNTYASGASGVDLPRLIGSEQLDFERGSYFYRDIFFNGKDIFLGQEIVYKDSKPIWGMNYVGNTISRTETDFLKEALYGLSDKCRLGNNCEYTKREFQYSDTGQGSLESFSGEEKISANGKNIYKLNYQGGLL